MQRFIVIGNPINHSKSPDIHHAFAKSIGLDICYQRQFCPDDPDSFVAVVEAFFAGGGTGANVTLPFKQIAFELAKIRGSLSDDAAAAGAVNTLALCNDKLYGDNTDGRGLVANLKTQGVDLMGKTVGILGAGGATRGAILPLMAAGAKIAIFNRTVANAERLVAAFDQADISAHSLADIKNQSFDVIINATSATTTGQSLDLGNSRAGFAYDMMYGKPSPFLAHFANQGSDISDGYGMLIHQAKLAFELWTGADVDLARVSLPKSA